MRLGVLPAAIVKNIFYRQQAECSACEGKTAQRRRKDGK
jgi:hypothetical protein